uniref:Uncharacterized protein n=1 Tax=Rhizophora mucronata TaxID=61149 RepID=A0A2P2PYJ6_RHIMU
MSRVSYGDMLLMRTISWC